MALDAVPQKTLDKNENHDDEFEYAQLDCQCVVF